MSGPFTKLVLATHNEGKVQEFLPMLAPLGVELISAGSLGLPEPEETGATFEENAVLKARGAAEASGLPALADDSGLVIPALDGAPGIHSARMAKEAGGFPAMFDRLERMLAERGAEPGSPAYFIAVLCLALPGGGEQCFEGRVEGRLSFPARGRAGFGYDPIFIPGGHAQTFSEFPPEVKNRLSHRARAVEKFIAAVANR